MVQLPIVLLLLLAIAILLRMDIVFYLVYVLTGAYVLARWWAQRSVNQLLVSRRFTDHIFTGETSTVEITITNRGLLPAPWVRYDESPPPTARGHGRLMHALALGPKEQVQLRYELVGRQRGVYAVGPGRVSSGDLFGFADVQGAGGRAAAPGRLPARHAVVGHAADVTARTAPLRAGIRFLPIRPV